MNVLGNNPCHDFKTVFSIFIAFFFLRLKDDYNMILEQV